jgi:DNA polymerase-1
MSATATATAKKRLILLDAHAILHRAYHALPDFATAKGEPTGALYGLSTMLIKIIEDLKPEYIVACYDVKGPTYRHEAYKEYKAGRQAAKDDLIAQMIRSRDIFTALNITIYDKEGFEADDMLGTIVEQLKDRTGEKGDLEIVIASGDMDTLQLVTGDGVKVFTLKKGINDTIIYNEQAVRDRFGFGPELIADYKGLRGDPSDNIIGVKGIGEKTATTLITTFGSIENMYKELEKGPDADAKFKAVGITPRIIQLLRDNKEEAEFSKMLATIRRDAPITFVFPEHSFKENLDIKKVSSLWHELEFRTLTPRLERVMSGNLGGDNVVEDKSGASDPAPDKDDLEKTAVALWLVNSTITNPQLEDVINFADSGSYEKAKKAIFAELDKRNLRKVYEDIELPLIPVIQKMEKRGIKIDRLLLANLAETYHAELSKLEKEIHKLAGVEFNINSPKQLGEILFDKLQLTAKNMKKTSGGARSTKESELEKLRDLHPIVPLLFEYRELAKLLSTYIDAIPPLLDNDDRLHSNFISSGSTTGRMASNNPNLQNIPIKSDLGKVIRGAFIAEKGFKLCSFDYSQIELRIAAFLSGDEKLLEIFRKGEDVHTSVASFVFKVPVNEVTPTMRRQAKVINFGIIYGMGVMALKQNLGTTRDEAQKFLNDYFETFSTLASYLDGVKAETARRGYTETFYGRRRYFEGINSKIPYIKASAERMAINAPIQGTEADVIKLAMIKIDKYIVENKLEKDVYPLLQVHDELVYEIVEDKAEEIAPQIEKIMESVMDPKDTKGIKLTASANIGDNWGELK